MPDSLPLFSPSALQRLPIPDAEIDWMEQLFSADEARMLFDVLRATTAWHQEEIVLYGRRILQPRLTAWVGDAEASYRYSGLSLTPQPWNDALLHIRQQVERVTRTQFNSVLLNLYRDGRDSMGWHSDNEAELGNAPVIASVSFGQTRAFQLKPRARSSTRPVRIDLTPGSLLVMRGATQANFLHAVPKDRTQDARINLTFRVIVQPVSRAGQS